jgi:hypothetical protein
MLKFTTTLSLRIVQGECFQFKESAFRLGRMLLVAPSQLGFTCKNMRLESLTDLELNKRHFGGEIDL